MIKLIVSVSVFLFITSCTKDNQETGQAIEENITLGLAYNDKIYEYNKEYFGISDDSIKIVFESPYKNELVKVQLDNEIIFDGEVTTNQISGIAGVVRATRINLKITTTYI